MTEIPIFVCPSSIEMHQERDVLQKVVFPSLNEKAKANGCSLRVVDLAWGVTESPVSNDEYLEAVATQLNRASLFVALLARGARHGNDAAWNIRMLQIYCAMASNTSTLLAFCRESPSDDHVSTPSGGDDAVLARLQNRGVNIDRYVSHYDLPTIVEERLGRVLERDNFSKIGTVFISYSGRENPVVHDTVEVLKNARFNVWIDDAEIREGRAWRGEIVAAIEAADAVLFLANRASVLSENCLDELAVARSRKKPVLSVFLEPAPISGELELMLSRFQHISFESGRPIGDDGARLCEAMRTIVGAS